MSVAQQTAVPPISIRLPISPTNDSAPFYAQLFPHTTAFSTNRSFHYHLQTAVPSSIYRYLSKRPFPPQTMAFIPTLVNDISPLMDDCSGSQRFYLQLGFLLPRLPTAVLGSIYACLGKRAFAPQPKHYPHSLTKQPHTHVPLHPTHHTPLPTPHHSSTPLPPCSSSPLLPCTPTGSRQKTPLGSVQPVGVAR